MGQQVAALVRLRPVGPPPEKDVPPRRERLGVDGTAQMARLGPVMDTYVAKIRPETRLQTPAERRIETVSRHPLGLDGPLRLGAQRGAFRGCRALTVDHRLDRSAQVTPSARYHLIRDLLGLHFGRIRCGADTRRPLQIEVCRPIPRRPLHLQNLMLPVRTLTDRGHPEEQP